MIAQDKRLLIKLTLLEPFHIRHQTNEIVPSLKNNFTIFVFAFLSSLSLFLDDCSHHKFHLSIALDTADEIDWTVISSRNVRYLLVISFSLFLVQLTTQ